MQPLRNLGIEVPHAAWRWQWARWRSTLLVLTLGLGLAGFISGVGVTERPELVEAGFLPKLYYTLGLFIFGGMDLGTPVGGPTWGRAVLWIAYFVAPVITASTVIEAVLRMVGADSLLLRRLEDHIVLGGCGRLTRLYLERLREVDKERAVVVIGSPNEAAELEELRELYRAQVVEGDVTSVAVLRRLRLERAARVLLLHDDDFTNLDAASRILDLVPEVASHVIVHVGDLRFMRSMAATGLAQRCHVFNGHQIAAAHLVQSHLLEHFCRTVPTDRVVLAGFGRFGQTVLDELQREAAGAFDRVVIVDLEATRRAAIFDEQVGFAPGYEVRIVDGDIRDPEVWKQVGEHIDLGQGEPVFVVGSGIDRSNLRIALTLSTRYPNGLIIARSDRQWSFAEVFSREAGIATVSVARLVAESMPQGWFGPRTEEPQYIEGPGASAILPIVDAEPPPRSQPRKRDDVAAAS